MMPTHTARRATLPASLMLVAALTLAACNRPAVLTTHATSDGAATYQRLVADLSDPKMEGRGPGTAGHDLATAYLVDAFTNAGLAPVFDVTWGSPGSSGRGFTQTFEIPLEVRAAEQALTVAGKPAVAGEDFNALGLSGDGKFSGGVVFVGYGIVEPTQNYDSYAGLAPEALRGKVAVAFRYEPQDEKGSSRWADASRGTGPWTPAASLSTKAHHAAKHGASALLIVNPPAQDTAGGGAGSLRSTASTDAAKAKIPVFQITTQLFKQMLRDAGADPDAALREYQRRADTGAGPITIDAEGNPVMETLKGVTAEGHARLERPKAEIANVVGKIPGSGVLADELIVIGAHYDHLGYGEIGSLAQGADRGREIHHGADDNASGTAGLVLLAHRLTAQGNAAPSAVAPGDAEHADAAAPMPDDRRTLLFVAFTGEERGLLGSNHFAQNLERQLKLTPEQIVAMINFDMIGRMREDRLYVLSADSGDRWTPIIRNAAHGLGLDLHIDDGSSFAASDHISFLTRRIPSIAFFTGVHSDYHRPSDTAEKINAEGAMKTIALADRVIRELTTGRRLRFVPSDVSPHARSSPGRIGGGAFLGVMPDYISLHGAEGVRLAGAVPGSPAETAGLKEGDRITAWDGEPIANIYTLTERLGQAKPDQDVTLTIERDKETLTLPVRLGRR